MEASKSTWNESLYTMFMNEQYEEYFASLYGVKTDELGKLPEIGLLSLLRTCFTPYESRCSPLMLKDHPFIKALLAYQFDIDQIT
jgi:hypothetical protein